MRANLRSPDPYFIGKAGFVGSTLEQLHEDMCKLELPVTVPDSVRRYHDAIRHAYIYSYFSYDLLTLAAGATFPCLEFALRLKLGKQFEGRVDRKGKPRLEKSLAAIDAAMGRIGARVKERIAGSTIAEG